MRPRVTATASPAPVRQSTAETAVLQTRLADGPEELVADRHQRARRHRGPQERHEHARGNAGRGPGPPDRSAPTGDDGQSADVPLRHQNRHGQVGQQQGLAGVAHDAQHLEDEGSEPALPRPGRTRPRARRTTPPGSARDAGARGARRRPGPGRAAPGRGSRSREASGRTAPPPGLHGVRKRAEEMRHQRPGAGPWEAWRGRGRRCCRGPPRAPSPGRRPRGAARPRRRGRRPGRQAQTQAHRASRRRSEAARARTTPKQHGLGHELDGQGREADRRWPGRPGESSVPHEGGAPQGEEQRGATARACRNT